MKDYFLPTANNNYHAKLLQQKSLILYLLIFLIFNILFSSLGLTPAKAQVDFTSLYNYHNLERAKYWLKPLSVNTDLIKSATLKANAMLKADCWSHYCPTGVSPWEYFDQAGYDYIFAGENLAEGFDGNESVMTAWMNSPSHRENIINDNFDEVGIGFAYGDFQGVKNNTIIVVHFGSRKQNPATKINKNGTLGESNSNLQILYPENGSYIGDPKPNIVGIKPIDSEIKILNDGQDLAGNIFAEGKNFTFAPNKPMDEGNHQLIAEAYDQDAKLLGQSEPINFSVDTKPPTVITESIYVDSLIVNSKVTVVIKFKTQGNPVVALSNIEGAIVTNEKLDEWSLEVGEKEIKNQKTLVIQAIDLAGNSDKAEVPIQNIVRQINEQEELITTGSEFSNFNLIIGKFFNKSIESKLIISFAFFLAGLLVLDSYIVQKTGLTGLNRGKSHLHLVSIIIFLIVATIGGLSGDILTGIFI